jgi:transmembrane protein TMEM174 (potassium channel)
MERRSDVARVEVFSDGVFAFAITLLVLAIRIPRLDDPDASKAFSSWCIDGLSAGRRAADRLEHVAAPCI